MRTSNEGLALIKKHEGLRLRAYDDLRPNSVLVAGDTVVGTVTIGYGHTKTAKAGMVINTQRAHELLADDLRATETYVHDLTDAIDLKQHEFDALVSFTFNVGVGALSQSTLLRLLLEGDRYGAAEQFERWVYSKGRRLPGLIKRRDDERSMFLGLPISHGG
jgi:lysozyme